MPAFIRLSTLLRRESKWEEPASKLRRWSKPWLREGNALDCWEGYRAEEGVSGIEFLDGESSAFRIVCNWRPMVFDTPDECLLWEIDQLPESRASWASECCLGRTGLCSAGDSLLVKDAIEGRACDWVMVPGGAGGPGGGGGRCWGIESIMTTQEVVKGGRGGGENKQR